MRKTYTVKSADKPIEFKYIPEGSIIFYRLSGEEKWLLYEYDSLSKFIDDVKHGTLKQVNYDL